jgi:hypothetical protein
MRFPILFSPAPLIQSPVGVTFDGNGRPYVLEMQARVIRVMLTATATGPEQRAIGQIRLHEAGI